MKENKISIIFLIASYVIGGFIFRSAYESHWKYPNGDDFTIYQVGIAEIFSPILVPSIGVPFIVGKIVTIGLPIKN